MSSSQPYTQLRPLSTSVKKQHKQRSTI